MDALATEIPKLKKV